MEEKQEEQTEQHVGGVHTNGITPAQAQCIHDHQGQAGTCLPDGTFLKPA